MTLASVMFYCGFDPYTGKKLYVARRKEEKLKQKEYFHRIIDNSHQKSLIKNQK